MRIDVPTTTANSCASIGLEVDLAAFADVETLVLLAAVTVLAVVTKLLGASLGARSLGPAQARFVAVGMVPRGEVGSSSPASVARLP